MSSTDKRHEDQRKYEIISVNECSAFQIICKNKQTFLRLFLHSGWGVYNAVLAYGESFEYFTYKTNNVKLEMFTIVSTCIGVGVTLAYFILDAGTTLGLN